MYSLFKWRVPDFVVQSQVLPSDTNVLPSDTNVLPRDTNVLPSDTNVLPSDTNDIIQFEWLFLERYDFGICFFFLNFDTLFQVRTTKNNYSLQRTIISSDDT